MFKFTCTIVTLVIFNIKKKQSLISSSYHYIIANDLVCVHIFQLQQK